MSFFKYHNYNNSGAIINHSCKSAEFIIHVGRQKDVGLVNVLDESGTLVWSKTYTAEAGLEFRKVMSFQQGYIILGVENGESPFLLRIDNSGNVIWHRSFKEISVKENIFIENFFDQYLHFAFHNTKANESGVILMSHQGDIISQKIILNSQGKREFKITGLATYSEMIFLSGTEVTAKNETGVVIRMDGGLGNIEANFTYLYDKTPLLLDGIYCRQADGTVLISGVGDETPYLLKPYDGYGAYYQQFREKHTRYAFGDNYFYVYNNRNEIIYSNYDYTHTWIKKLDVNELAIDQVSNSSPVFHGLIDSQNYSGYLGNDFNTCRTVPMDFFRPTLIEFIVNPVDYGLEPREFEVSELAFDINDLQYDLSDVCEVGNVINFNDFSGLQTPDFYLQAAGSRGEDSTKGIHLRWSLGGKLGENHLPKGNLAHTNVNYNKPNDFVKIYRAPYTKAIFKLDFSIAPQMVDDSQKLWVYKFNNDQRIFYVYFKNKEVYNHVRQNTNPLVYPLKFIEAYGYEVIEVQCKTDLFFAAEAGIENINSSSVLDLEGLSVSNVNNPSQQYLTYRKQNFKYDVANNYFNAENGKAIRFRAGNSFVSSIAFEFYSDFILARNAEQAWKHIGNFALTLDTETVYKRLDPLPDTNPVNGAWLRYNDNAYVNTENYKTKWEHQSTGPLDRDIQAVVQNYLSLSDAQPNPKAYETINFNFAPTNDTPFVDISTDPVEDGSTQVSNLDILNIASLDYHVARMLGLGHLDAKNEAFDQEFIYIAEYYTNQNLDINSSDKSYQLLSMSLPVSTDIERLSLPVDLMKLAKGMDSGNQNSANLYNSEGYSHDGKYRYISLYNYQVPENELNPAFFSSSVKYDASQFTTPVYAGLEHRLVEPGQTDTYLWKKPELCHDTQYFHLDSSTQLAAERQETLPIQIPDTYTPLYMHKQDKTGTYFYKGYGINWFSRAQYGQSELSIVTEIKPFNKLLPPSGATAFNIQKEIPPTFTTQMEQGRLNAITNPDKTLARLTFDYHIYQDEIGYSVPFDSTLSDTDLISDPNAIFPDNKEVFADEVEIFYRNYTPRVISAKAYDVIQHPGNQLLAIIKTTDLPLASTGTAPNPTPNQQNSSAVTTLYSEFPLGTTASDFIGGIFLMDSESYIINEIIEESLGLTFTVFKKAASDAIIAGTTPLINQASLTLPVINPGTEGFFSVTENMQNTPTWGVKNPNTLKVQIGSSDWTINREVIHMPQANGEPQRYLEKSRGIWKNATVEKFYEKIEKYQNSQGTVIEFPANHPHVFQGVYKITFPGFKMAQHPQISSNSHSVEWFNGIVRLFTVGNYNNGLPTDSRSIFKVVRTENIGSTTEDLVLYFYDENFTIRENALFQPILDQEFLDHEGTEPILLPGSLTDPYITRKTRVNYYPSYKVYLHENEPSGFVEDVVLPPVGEDVRYSIFGFKSVDNDNFDPQGNKYKSKFSAPTVMFAQRIVQPEKPKKPTGSKYATRPDKFGKSTYSILTEYIHKPYSVQFFRANNSLLLGSLYEPETIAAIKEALNEMGGNEEEYFNDRWMNFVDFTMLENIGSEEYGVFPPNGVGGPQYRLPLPDSTHLFTVINEFIEEHNNYYNLSTSNVNYSPPLTIADRGNMKFNQIVIKPVPSVSGALSFGSFIKERLSNCFLPLTEVPVIYQHIKPLDVSTVTGHRPINKKQNIRDANGYLLPPTHADFDMAPMAAIYSQTPSHSTLFTDFTLDGASDNFYFYGVRELGNQMQMGEFSEFAGPIKLVNTNPAESPKIMSLLPVVDNATLGITAKVRVEVNPFREVQKITKVSLYRATNKLDADSILSMDHVKTVDIADVEVDEVNGTWVLYDEFEDMVSKPYGDLLFYRIVVTRKVEYSTTDYNVSPPAEKVVVEQAPSLPSKVVVSTLVENYNPPTPELNYHSEPVAVDSDTINWVILSWDQICYKGKYQLYKLSNQGNWKEIARINTDTKDISKAHLYLSQTNTSTNAEEWVMNETFDLTAEKFYLPLQKVNLDPMQIKDADGNILYHHFKLVAQNTSNMFSTQEKILTIYKEETWSDIGGISSDGTDGMITQGTFIIRPNI